MHYRSISHEELLKNLPDRELVSHKGDYGKVLMLCGSRGFTGAAALAAMGALRTGAGLVYLGVPESIYTIEATKLNEPIVFPLPDENGMYSASAVREINQYLPKMDAVLIGCGMGCSAGTAAVLESVLEKFDGPVVLDADGINLIAPHKDILRGRSGTTILTPHEGEFVRIFGRPISDRKADAMELAQSTNSIVVLKGHETVITDGEVCFVNPTGNPGMAVGGSGDVLAGVIVSFLGQGIEPILAAACGAWIHGAAGDICAEEIGQFGMLPSDMIQVLPRLLK